MFICTECKSKYEQKPNYCDCGNDIFDEITEIEEEKKLSTGFEKEVNFEQTKPKKDFFEQYPGIKNFLDSLDILSTSIFAICIILSILAWIFIGKENPNVVKHKKTVVQTQRQIKQKQIPDLDSFWNSSKPAIQKPLDAEDIENAKPGTSQTEVEKTSEITKPSPERTKIIAPSSIQKTLPKNGIVQPAKQKTTKQNISSNNEAMSQYKAALRQTLFSHLAVTSITGTGRCRVEFSVSSSGKILNRRFSKLSDNKSLNDAVYNMLMSVPQYYPPPAGYNGEKIGLSFYFNNGYYEVSY